MRGQGQAGSPRPSGPTLSCSGSPAPQDEGRLVAQLSTHVCKRCLRGEHLTLPVAKALEGAVIRAMAVITGLRGTQF